MKSANSISIRNDQERTDNQEIKHDNNEDSEEEIDNINISSTQDGVTTWIYNHRLGYNNIFIRNVGNQALMSHEEENDDGSTLPIHPLLGFNRFFHLYMNNLLNPNKSVIEGWKEIGDLAFNGQSQMSLLKGITLLKKSLDNKVEKYTIYAKRDFTILSAPGHNAEKVVTDRFNFIEVRNKYVTYTLFFLSN
jgi:hypothetical protein